MVVIKKVSAKHILDSRREKTIFVSIETNVGKFFASSPTGKSTGKHEAKPYRNSLEEDIEALKKFRDYFSDEIIDNFSDLRRIEDITEGHIGANSLFALESAILKALAKEKKKQIWQLVNPEFSKNKRNVATKSICVATFLSLSIFSKAFINSKFSHFSPQRGSMHV